MMIFIITHLGLQLLLMMFLLNTITTIIIIIIIIIIITVIIITHLGLRRLLMMSLLNTITTIIIIIIIITVTIINPPWAAAPADDVSAELSTGARDRVVPCRRCASSHLSMMTMIEITIIIVITIEAPSNTLQTPSFQSPFVMLIVIVIIVVFIAIIVVIIIIILIIMLCITISPYKGCGHARSSAKRVCRIFKEEDDASFNG